MSLLVPLGLLGLLGIAALILIYILKPNYQQKIISSTYVWKLSLRYRKKKIPVSRLRNIILLICQILTIAACAFIMTKPIAEAAQPLPGGEKIAVIDASAGMLTEGKTDTRFERAVRQVKSLARETFAKNERISVILAGTSASYLVQRSDATKAEDVYERLDSLVSGSLQCSYGSADMDGAMKLAEGVLELNPDAEILLYTGTEYIAPGEVTVVDVAEEGEWNAAILDVEAELRENYYAFTVSVACYGADEELTVNFAFSGVNYDKTALSWSTVVPCSGGETQVFVLDTSTYGGEGIYSFDSLRVYIQTRDDDSFGYDNNFYFYGARETIRIQYASARPNDFFGFALMSLRSNSFLQREWNIELVEVQNKTPETEGFDFYIFESMLPDPVPNDGVVFLVDPPEAPPGLGVTFAGTEEGEVFFTAGESNRILDAVDPTAVSVSQYRKVASYDGFQPLMYAGDDPVLLLRDEPMEKVVLMPFSLNYSNQSMLKDFPILFGNIYRYFFPYSLLDVPQKADTMPVATTVFEVGESASINSVGDELSISAPDGNVASYGSFPEKITLTAPGAYTLSHRLISGRELKRNFYVKLPALESNIYRTEDELNVLSPEREKQEEDKDFRIWFAIPLVALLFIEWWLQAKENF